MLATFMLVPVVAEVVTELVLDMMSFLLQQNKRFTTTALPTQHANQNYVNAWTLYLTD
jgi:hypothetical protein